MTLEEKSIMKVTDNMPSHIRVGLFGINSRKVALVFEAVCLVLGISSFVGSFYFQPIAFGMVFFASAYWYSISIRWADNNSAWER